MNGYEPALRLRPLWLAIGWLAVGVVVYLSLTTRPPVGLPSIPYADKLGHTLAYLLLMGGFVQLYRNTGIRLLLAGGFIALGVTLEVLQGAGGVRQFEYADMAANSLGVCLGLALGWSPLVRFLPWLERALFGRWLG